MTPSSIRSRRIKPRGTLIVAGAAALALLTAGCGEIHNTIKPKRGTTNQFTLELSGPPNAYYVGLYAAQALGLFKQTDMDVSFQTPTAGQNPLTMLHDGQVLAAISSEPSVFLARNLDMPVVAVGALVQRPLSQIPVRVVKTRPPSGGVPVGGATTTAATTTPGVTTPGATTTGTTTSATTTATSATPTATATTPGASTVSTTTTPTPSEVPTGSAWPAQLQQLLAAPGAPTYTALAIVVRKGTIVQHAGLVRRFVQAAARGYRAVRRDPRAGVADLIAADPALAPQKRQLLATVRATLRYFFPASGDIWGWQSEADWNTFGTWMFSHKLITNQNAISDASTNELLQGEGV